MKNLRVKKTRMICSVKGCGARETYFLTKGGDFAGTPNMCKDCLKKAYENIAELEAPAEATEVITDDERIPETVQEEVVTEDAVQEAHETDEAAEEQIPSEKPEKAETVKKSGGNSSKRKTAKKGDK